MLSFFESIIYHPIHIYECADIWKFNLSAWEILKSSYSVFLSSLYIFWSEGIMLKQSTPPVTPAQPKKRKELIDSVSRNTCIFQVILLAILVFNSQNPENKKLYFFLIIKITASVAKVSSKLVVIICLWSCRLCGQFDG